MRCFSLFAFVSMVMTAAVSCADPIGTCMIPERNKGSDLGDACFLNVSQSLCKKYQGGAFVGETPAAGLMRCKSEGYDFVGGSGAAAAQSIKDGKVVNLYRKKP